ncbi:MAG: response regulator [Rickettsiales bacterium]|nr:response regulator [Pseudomonadota bacterium]MDA0966837.1 response regulator [Pseudomonadota bacterium]MDG4543511.1 response regulator [Rickettsiales bacterium]MDG4546095.1 response regulator [Rickettsiales bacterium]MDG4547568.1 response regulator [Rickettsiales bacterium]
MQSQNIKVMAVDDDDINLEILIKNLKDSGYDTLAYNDGHEAWQHMNDNPESFDIVLLDKMMPKMNGMDLLSKMKEHSLLKNIPVIIQTGDVGVNEVRQGMERGAYYYLCKPFDSTIMVAMVNAASRDCIKRNNIYKRMKDETSIAEMLKKGHFEYKNIAEAKKLASAISCKADKPDRINTALLELMVNSVEHGLLSIGHEEKGKLLAHDNFAKEIDERSKFPENAKKTVDVFFNVDNEAVTVKISDKGQGFNWRKYEDFDPLRLTEPNGRGIATAKLMAEKIEYNESGNEVTCTFNRAIG